MDRRFVIFYRLVALLKPKIVNPVCWSPVIQPMSGKLCEYFYFQLQSPNQTDSDWS